MTKISIHVDPDVHRRLRQHARETGTSVSRLLTDLLTVAAVFLPTYNPAINPVRLPAVAAHLDRLRSPELISEVLQVPLDEIHESIRHLKQLERELGKA